MNHSRFIVLAFLAVWLSGCGGLECNRRRQPIPAQSMVFEQNFGGFNTEIVARSPQGVETRLTNNSVVDEDPSVTADGTKIVFTSRRDGNGDIYIMNADGSGVTRLTTDGTNANRAEISADGTKIVFVRSNQIWIMDSDGTDQLQLTNNAFNNQWPSFNGDATQIVFMSNQALTRDEIYRIDADGTNLTRLTNNGLHDSEPTFSPDGTKVAFARERDFNEPPDLWIMNADGTGEVRLTNNGSVTDTEPDFSATGSHILFRRGVLGQIFVMAASGSGDTVQITTSSGPKANPHYGP